ncbi:SGNH/GDSL hydrolase family protein [Microcoleus sp. FACHB-1515]|uniref:SGNH/GDSL hydrolase family protein n=1 Tax=Cyanophyceae TaxID=3028117 RepID=UPI00168697B0|nr:SGNH/GDSL hydrolase family protein [Microcoleus sp. FACHB-1515]MBD2088552.1 SGNH/GDSL hydrolase family protein [Microcoleus sp. FACHB-1515]
MTFTQHLELIRSLVVFGDSLSDTGTVFRATGGLYPPRSTYFNGRYSNGRVWVEYLGDRLAIPASQIENFACGGATSSGGFTNMIPGLLAQVQSYLQTHSQLDSGSLFVLWAGGNDYLQGATNAAVPVGNLVRAIELLANAGASKILIANQPDLGQLPATRNTANSARLSELSRSHNSQLRRSIKQLMQQHPNLQIALFDANALYHEAIETPAKFGFTNVMQAAQSIGGNPDQSLFWDGIHPTTAAHRILSDRAFATLQGDRLIPAQAA